MSDHKFGAKLTLEQVQFVRLNWGRQKRHFWRQLAEKWGVLPVSIRRIGEGRTWKESYVEKRTDDSKPCVVCGNFFFQRIEGKPRKSDARFAKQQTCSFGCAGKLRWQTGSYRTSDFVKTRKPRRKRQIDVGASDRNPSEVCNGGIRQGRPSEDVSSDAFGSGPADCLQNVERASDEAVAGREEGVCVVRSSVSERGHDDLETDKPV